jgi:hypothetical protein
MTHRVLGLSLSLLAATLAATAQPAPTVPRIGYLSLSSSGPVKEAFVFGPA